MDLNLDVSVPEEVPSILRKAAQQFAESAGDLAASWGDKQAGKVWQDFANILDRAANAADNAIAKRLK